MPRSLDPRTLRARSDTDRVIVPASPETRGMRDSRITSDAERRIAETKLNEHNATHNADRRDCEHCERENESQRSDESLALAANRAARRNARKVYVPHTGDIPRKVGRKVRTTRNVVTPTIAGDTTDNAPSRKIRATQRYAEDLTTRTIGDTVTTLPDGTRRIKRSRSPLNVREEGRTNVQATLYVVAYYRYLLSTQQKGSN